MHIAHASFSCQGPRSDNQDRLLEPIRMPSGVWITAIADGVGGGPGGADAATIAVNATSSMAAEPSEFDSLFAGIVSQIRIRASQNNDLQKMATTLSVVIIRPWRVDIAHVGDTRIYHLREAGLMDLTRDQTEVAELRRKGVLTEYQARRYPRKNVLTSALSARGDYEVYRADAVIRPGDRLLLVTDGVYEKVLRRSVLDLSLANETVATFAIALQENVLESGPTDNYSAIAIEIQN